MFSGIVLIHRVVSYVPTYSEFKYDALSFTSVILAFFVIMLSIQTKMGIKANILYDRAMELWNGPSDTKIRRKRGNDHQQAAPDSIIPAMTRAPAVGHQVEPVPAPMPAGKWW